MKNLKNLLDDHQTGMSQFQDDFFVTTKAGGTLYGQYKQSLRELYKRFRGLREISCGIEKQEIDIEELEYKIKNRLGSTFDHRRNKVDYKEKVMQMEESQRIAKDTKREFIRFYQQADYFKKQIGELTDEKRHQLDQEMWVFKVKEMAVIDWITSGVLRNSTYELLNSLPKNLKKEVAFDLKNQNQLIDWYENRDEILFEANLPKLKEISTKKILELELNM